MGYTKTIVCLANSRKPPSGRCVAGREMLASGFGDWVRPVSTRPTQEISEEERRYKDGVDPQVLDVIAIPLIKPQPQNHQQENHVIDVDCYWEKKGTVSWSDLQAAVEDPKGPLWLNGYSSSNGENDQIPQSRASKLTRSLYLIRPDVLRLAVASEGGSFGPPRRRVRALFKFFGHRYCLVVTDPQVERDYLRGKDGEFKLDDALLCVSLGESYHGYAYKLAAAVITPKRSRGKS